MSRTNRLLTVGGGVGGLALSLSMAQRGADVLLVEKQPEFSVPGVGLGQPANALRIYRELGVLEEVLACGFRYDHMAYFDSSRHLLAEHRFLLGDPETPAVCALPRADLHSILRRAAERAGVEIRLGTTVTEFKNHENAVTARFSDGTSERFDVAAGFDGIRSTTRETLFGGAYMPRTSGYGAWRVQVPRPSSVTGMEFMQGLGSKTGAMPLADELMYLFHIRPEDPNRWFNQAEMPSLLRSRLAEYGGYVAEVRESLADDSSVVYGPLDLLLVPAPWHRGRIALGGDAVHVFPPHLTQGAAMAVEDALVLTEELCSDAPVEEQLTRYAERRYARCAFVYNFARQMLDDEQSVRTESDMLRHRVDTARYASERIATSDRILNQKVIREGHHV